MGIDFNVDEFDKTQAALKKAAIARKAAWDSYQEKEAVYNELRSQCKAYFEPDKKRGKKAA